jgi:hypothetical protein
MSTQLRRQVFGSSRRPERALEPNPDIQRAYAELNPRNHAAASTIEALMYALRRGVNELTKPDTQRRLSELSEDRLHAVCERLQNLKPEIAPAWAPEEIEALMNIWSAVHGH